MNNVEYDETDPFSIERYAQYLIGKTFSQICIEDEKSSTSIVKGSDTYDQDHENGRGRAGGDLCARGAGDGCIRRGA